MDIAENNFDGQMIELLDDKTVEEFQVTFRGVTSFRMADMANSVLMPKLSEDQPTNVLNTEVDSVLRGSGGPSGFQFLEQGSNQSLVNQLATLEEETFPEMAGWLDKKNSAPPFTYHARYVIVKQSYFLWNDVKVQCGDPTDKEERKKFKHINLLQVDKVNRVKTKKFKVVVNIGDKKKEFLWQAKTEKERNRWVMDLQYRVEHARKVIGFLYDPGDITAQFSGDVM